MATNIKLKSFENMFKSTDPDRLTRDNEIVKLSLDSLVPFKEHPFKRYSDEKMAVLVESIKQYGVLTPIITREIEVGKYEIIAGYNRTSGAKIAGIEHIPGTIVEADDDLATLMMIESNFNQRDVILPSERGRAYKLQLEALARRGKRTDLTSCQNDTMSGTAKEIAEMNDLSRKQLFRYIRLTELIDELSDLVDHNKLNFTFGVELSYLLKEHQLQVFELLEEKGYSLNATNVYKMKELEKKEQLTDEKIKELMQVQKQESKPDIHKQVDQTIKRFKLPVERAAGIIEKALELYMETEDFKKEMNMSG